MIKGLENKLKSKTFLHVHSEKHVSNHADKLKAKEETCTLLQEKKHLLPLVKVLELEGEANGAMALKLQPAKKKKVLKLLKLIVATQEIACYCSTLRGHFQYIIQKREEHDGGTTLAEENSRIDSPTTESFKAVLYMIV